MSELKHILMNRDRLSSEDADSIIEEMKAAVLDGENPEDVLLDYVGLEPDYILDIIDNNYVAYETLIEQEESNMSDEEPRVLAEQADFGFCISGIMTPRK